MPTTVTHKGWEAKLDPLAEREALYLISRAQGNSLKEVAREFGVSPNTVKNACTRAFTKMHVWKITEAISQAMAEGLLRKLSITFLISLSLGAVDFSENPYRLPQNRTRTSVVRVRPNRRDDHAA